MKGFQINKRIRLLVLGGIIVFAILFISRISPVRAAIADGANAVDLLGEYDGTSLTNPQPTYTKSGVNDSPNRLGFSGPTGAVLDSVYHRFFLSDTANSRVLIYNLNTDNTFPDRIADNVLGQPNFVSNTTTVSQSRVSSTQGLAFDSVNNRLFVADSGNNRVLIFDVSTITNGQNASNVLGQSNFTSNSATTTQSGMNTPVPLAYDTSTGRLFVGESTNRRVTIFNVTSTVDGQNAANILGQINFTTNVASNTQSGINTPSGLAYDNVNGRLFVAATGNNRVTVFSVPTTTVNGQAAVGVLGQSTFTATAAATTQVGMSAPRGVVYDSTNSRLFVAQSGNHRVTIYNVTTTISNGASAVNVLGQINFTSSTASTTQSGVNSPQGLVYDSGNNRLLVVEATNRRVTIFNVASITDGQNAVDALGQYDGTSLSDPQPIYTKSGVNDSPNRLGFNSLYDIAMDSTHHRLFVVERSNRRVLVYNLNTDNTLPDRIPDNVLGQLTFVSSVFTTSQSTMGNPQGLAYDSTNNRLFVSDLTGNRVLVFDVSSITNGQNAVNVLGQSDFTSTTGTSTQSGMNGPGGMDYDSTNSRLFVADGNNHRVTVFNVASISDGQNAVNVFGQTSFTANISTTSQSSVTFPGDVTYDSVHNRLFVIQSSGSRVTVFDVTTISDNQNAVNVLGQPNFTSSTAVTTQAGVNTPGFGAYDSVNNRLFVSDYGSARILVYDTATIADGENAVNVLGQPNFTSSTAATTQAGVNAPFGLVYDSTNNRLYASDFNLNRITVYDAALAAAPLANSAGTPVVSSPTLSTLNLTFSTNSNSASTTYAIFNTTTNAYVAADGSSNSSTPVYFSSSSWSGVVSGLSPNTAYQFSVIARNSDGINAATSSVSSAVYTLSSVPTSLSTTLVAPDVISLAWAGDSSAYYITNETLATASGWVANLSFSFSGLNCNTTFVFSVKGRNGAGVETASSTALSATTGACSTVGVPAGFTPSVVYVPSGVQTITPVNSVLVIPIVSSSLPVPFIPIIYSPQEDLFLRSFYPASDVQFIQLPVSSVLFSRQFLRYAYLFTNQDKARTVSVVREIVNDKGVIIARSGGKRSLKAGQSFSYTPSPTLIASFWKPGIYTFRIRVNDIAGHLISINAFRFQIQKR